MTERPAIEVCEPFGLIAVDVWDRSVEARMAEALDGALPAAGCSAPLGGGWRAIRVEPTAWWLSGPREDGAGLRERLEAALGGAGAAVDLTGGFAQMRIAGEGWRNLLMIGGVFDAEDPAFAPGRTAGTVLHHVTVRYDVVAANEVRVYAPPSYLDDLLHHWGLGEED